MRDRGPPFGSSALSTPPAPDPERNAAEAEIGPAALHTPVNFLRRQPAGHRFNTVGGIDG
ncbi:MAG: hypothetical protein JO258_12300, partial [Alphaproteobacteria bacterium]|nr:hypothetical protein [Alphaproteobacteria bacterium]